MTKPLSLRQVQAVWGCAIAFAVVCIVFGAFARKPFDGGLNLRHWLLIGLVAWSAWGGIAVQRRLARRAITQSRGTDSAAALRAWTASQLLGIALAEGIVLWALVSNLVIASPHWLSDAFYTLGALLLFKFMPRNPPQVL